MATKTRKTKTKTKTAAPTALRTLIEQSDGIVAKGLETLYRHIRGELAAELAAMSPDQAVRLANLLRHVATIKTTMAEGERP